MLLVVLNQVVEHRNLLWTFTIILFWRNAHLLHLNHLHLLQHKLILTSVHGPNAIGLRARRFHVLVEFVEPDTWAFVQRRGLRATCACYEVLASADNPLVLCLRAKVSTQRGNAFLLLALCSGTSWAHYCILFGYFSETAILRLGRETNCRWLVEYESVRALATHAQISLQRRHLLHVLL